MPRPNELAPMLAFTTFAVWLFPLLSIAGPSRSHAKGELLRLSTGGLPTPMLLPGDPLRRNVTSIVIQGEMPGDGDAKGSITFGESPLTFNEFGDAKKTGPKAQVRPIIFRPVPLERDKNHKGRVFDTTRREKRRLYELVFADGSFPRQLYLAVGADTAGPHRLLVWQSGAPQRPTSSRTLAALFDLHGLPPVPDALGDAPLRPAINFATLFSSPDGRLRRLAIGGVLGGPATLTLDPNYLDFNVLGDITSTTLIGYEPIKAALRQSKTPDPANKGRRIFEVVPTGRKLEERYFLVLWPTQAGPHRLLIRKGDKLRQLLPLHDPERGFHRAMQPQLERVPLPEQRAIADLRQTIGYGFRFQVESRTIAALTLHTGDAADRIDPILKHLKNLRRLEFNGSRLNAVGLASLHNLSKLQELRFVGAYIHDRGLASVKDLTQLQGLSFYVCQGITDRGMVHLAGLKNLKRLELYREDSLFGPAPNVELITDAGLEYLQGLAQLESLNLMGQKITDAGLERLKGLPNIKELYLSGKGITDAGLEHLKGLSHLKYLHLYETRVTPAGQNALKSKLPMLEIGG